MQGDNPISWLMFFTLAASVFIIAGAFIYFLRSRTNREIASEALGGDGSRKGATPNGAGPELIGFAVIGIAVMGLLATGYSGKSRSETAQLTTPVSGTTTGMAQTGGYCEPAQAVSAGQIRRPIRARLRHRRAPVWALTTARPDNPNNTATRR